MPKLPHKLILASRSPRRRSLLTEAGYDFEIRQPDEAAECGVRDQETPSELVARLAYQKAGDVARQVAEGVVLGCDTIAECQGRILGKPRDEQHARKMLQLLRGQVHHVYSGVCLWQRPTDKKLVKVDVTKLRMERVSDKDLDAYLESRAWEGKAGAFGYQDRTGWLHIVAGSESNVVGLPMELLAKMLAEINGT